MTDREESRETDPSPPKPSDWIYADSLGGHIGPYRIVEELGEGGMGKVYLGLKEWETGQQRAAIKVLRPQAGIPTETLAREATVLSGLEHPSIARLVDFDRASDGRWYLACEYIEGEHLDVYCDEHRLTIRERVALLHRICCAVRYAHSHFVIHRDLKPQNIFVTESGEPRLLDFGVAMFSKTGPGTAQFQYSGTRGGMTPTHASPEQIRGGRICAQNDVYSLGIILHELLVGSLPYELGDARSPEDLLRIVTAALPCRPVASIEGVLKNPDEAHRRASLRSTSVQAWQREVRGDLDSIVAKACAEAIHDRYDSAAALAEDLEAYLEQRPVAAVTSGVRLYRARKFVRRHRVSVAASCVTMVVLASLLVALFVALQRSEAATVKAETALENEAIARAKAEDARREAEDSKQTAEVAREEAVAARDDSELSRAFLDAAWGAVSDVSNSLSPKQREDLWTAVGENLDAIAKRRGPETRRVILAQVHALKHLADAYFTVEGNSDANTRDALEVRKRVLDLISRLHEAYPDDEEVALDMAEAGVDYGTALHDAREARDAEARLRDVLTLLEPWASDRSREITGKALLKLSDVQRTACRYDESEASIEQALEIRRELMRQSPSSTRHKRNHGVAIGRLAEIELARGDLASADRLFRQQLGIRIEARERDPDDATERRDVALTESLLSGVLSIRGRHDEAVELANRAVVTASELVPAEPRFRDRVTVIYCLLSAARAELAAGSLEAALSHCDEALTAFEDLASHHPFHSNLGEYQAEILALRGRTLAALGQSNDARTDLTGAHNLLLSLVASRSTKADLWAMHIRVLRSLVELESVENPEKAANWLERMRSRIAEAQAEGRDCEIDSDNIAFARDAGGRG